MAQAAFRRWNCLLQVRFNSLVFEAFQNNTIIGYILWCLHNIWWYINIYVVLFAVYNRGYFIPKLFWAGKSRSSQEFTYYLFQNIFYSIFPLHFVIVQGDNLSCLVLFIKRYPLFSRKNFVLISFLPFNGCSHIWQWFFFFKQNNLFLWRSNILPVFDQKNYNFSKYEAFNHYRDRPALMRIKKSLFLVTPIRFSLV